MKTKEKLNIALKTNQPCNLIVALPDHISISQAVVIAENLGIKNSLESALFPYSISMADATFIFGLKEKFSDEKYRENFLEKCESTLGQNLDISLI